MYCVKCKKVTNTKKKSITYKATKNNRRLKQGQCSICGVLKSQFVKNDWLYGSGIREDIIEEIHKPLRKNYPRRFVITNGVDDLWQADLVEMDAGKLKGISKINKGYKYLVTIIDTFSKFAFAIPVKDKTGINITKAFKSILNIRKPKNLQTDQGKEFYNKEFKELIKEYNINHYSTYSGKKASVVERFNRTLKEKMWRQFTVQGNYKWVEILPKLVKEYNNTVHRKIEMKPIDVKKSDEKKLLKTVYKQEYVSVKCKFKVGDRVRISKAKGIFEKGYTPNWSTEVFEIYEAIPSNPPTYRIKDINGEQIKGLFYEQEMLKTKHPEAYLVEKVLRRKGDKVYVKWLGFSESHNSWVDKSSVVM